MQTYLMGCYLRFLSLPHIYLPYPCLPDKQALITKTESEDSSVSLGEAKDFIAEKAEAVKAESQPPAAGDDAEDLVSCDINYKVDNSSFYLNPLKSLSIYKKKIIDWV